MINGNSKYGKQKGIVGRSSKEEIEKRRRIMKDILDTNYSDLTLAGFKKILISHLSKKGKDGKDIPLPTDETLKKDCLEIGYMYKSSNFQIKEYSSEAEEMVKNILLNRVYEVSATFRNNEYIFYPFLNEDIIEYVNEDGIINKTINGKTKYQSEEYGEYYNNQLESLLKEIKTNYDTVKISIVLNEHSYEQTLADIFLNTLGINILYISINICGIDIYCKKQDLRNLFNFIFNILPDEIYMYPRVTTVLESKDNK